MFGGSGEDELQMAANTVHDNQVRLSSPSNTIVQYETEMDNNDVEYDDYNWDRIESLLGQLAVRRYAYKFAYDAASDMEEDEWQYQNELEINDAMMGDRV